MADHGVDLLRVSAGVNRKVLAMLGELESDVAARLARSNISATARARLGAVESDVNELISDQYSGIGSFVTQRMAALAPVEAAVTAGTVNSLVGVSIMDGVLPSSTLKTLFSDVMIRGAPSSKWWAKQASDVIFRFAQQVRLGMAQGETNGQIVTRVRGSAGVPGLLDGPRRNAEALVRTSVQTVANAARKSVFDQNNDVLKGYQQVSTLDTRTTEICIAYDGAAWDMDGNPIAPNELPFINDDGDPENGVPRHWGCRSTLIPLVKSWEELGVHVKEFSPSVRVSMDGEVAAKMTYDDWLEGRSEAEQADILGAGKAKLWREGKITVTDLLDQKGRPMTLADLKEKHGLQ